MDIFLPDLCVDLVYDFVQLAVKQQVLQELRSRVEIASIDESGPVGKRLQSGSWNRQLSTKESKRVAWGLRVPNYADYVADDRSDGWERLYMNDHYFATVQESRDSFYLLHPIRDACDFVKRMCNIECQALTRDHLFLFLEGGNLYLHQDYCKVFNKTLQNILDILESLTGQSVSSWVEIGDTLLFKNIDHNIDTLCVAFFTE